MPVERIDINLTARVFGFQKIDNLRKQLRQLQMAARDGNTLAKKVHLNQKIAHADLDLRIQQIRVLRADEMQMTKSMIRKQITLDAEANALERANAQYRVRQLILIDMGLIHATEEERTFARLQLLEIEKEKNKELAIAMQFRRREILATTMSVFGMTMSIWQLTNALSAMAGENKELKEDFQRMQAMLMGATAPLLLVTGILQLTTMQVTALGAAMMTALPIAFALATAYLAISSNSREMRIIMGALTGALIAFTIAKHKAAIASLFHAGALHSETVAMIVQKAVASLGLLLPVIAGAIIGAIAVAAMLPKAQTQPGQMRFMRQDAAIFAHQDEVVSKPMENFGDMAGGGRGGDIKIFIDGYQIDHVEAKETERNNYVGW